SRATPAAATKPNSGQAAARHWRDAQGHLVWGVNDFDEAAHMPYAFNLVRLAASASLAPNLRVGKKRAAAILTGYRAGLRAPQPMLLDEHQTPSFIQNLCSAAATKISAFGNAGLSSAPSKRFTWSRIRECRLVIGAEQAIHMVRVVMRDDDGIDRLRVDAGGCGILLVLAVGWVWVGLLAQT